MKGTEEPLGQNAREDIDRGIAVMDTFVTFAEDEWPVTPRGSDSCSVRPRHFNGALPISGCLHDQVVSDTFERISGPSGSYGPEVRPQMLGSFDVRLLKWLDDEQCWYFLRLTSTDPRQWRGWPVRIAPQMVKAQMAWLAESPVGADSQGLLVHQEITVAEFPVGRWQDTDAWICLDRRIPNTPPELSRNFLCGMFYAFLQHYSWRVQFRHPGSPLGVSLPVTQSDLAALFATREIPMGRDRRVALQHWVTGHWRRQTTAHDYETMVREHLRGAQQFDWHGFECHIMPSTSDQWQAMRAQMRRAMARRDGVDHKRISKEA